MPSWTSACLKVPIGRKYDGSGSYSRQLAPGDDFACGTFDANGNTDDRRGVSFIELNKKDRATLGLIISGGIDKGSRPRISNLRPGGLAYRSDSLCVGDHIVSVNGIRTAKLKHEEIINLLKNAEGHITLEVEYDLPFCPSDNSPCLCPKVIQVRLIKENGSFGFVLRGGAAYGCPLTVTYVRPGGPADRDGTIKAGDRILAVNSVNLFPATQVEAITVLKQIKDEGVFTVEYDVSLLDAVRHASGPLLVEIERGGSGNQQLGVALSSSLKEPSSILIHSIKQASLAERCGALHVGDSVLAIDGVPLEGTTAAEASQLLKNSCGDKICLEILPLSQMFYGKRLPEVSVRKGTSVSSFATLGSVYRHPQRTMNDWRCQRSMEASPSSSSLPSCVSSCSASMSPPLCRLETTDVTLCADQRGFGFALQSSPSAAPLAPPVVVNLDPGGPAERSGVIQAGDRILSVNGISVENVSVEDVSQMLLSSKPRVNLKVEFDVAESVVPSSGVFDVKLPCKSSGGLGITITASKDRRLGDHPVISDVRRGGVAHRTGTIHVGDRLMAIGSVFTDEYSLEEAIQFLKDCREEVVRLRIRKDDLQTVIASSAVTVMTRIENKNFGGIFKGEEDETENIDWIVYVVEMVRRGNGPLGITVAGSEEPCRPIVLSALTEGGLAQQTGSLHVGDRLLAVNGIPLRDKTLGSVIQLLQNSGDVVTLKVARNVGESSEGFFSQEESPSSKDGIDGDATPLPSIDSAVESWDESITAFDGYSLTSHHGGITTILRHQKRNSGRLPTSSSSMDGDPGTPCEVEEENDAVEAKDVAEELDRWQRQRDTESLVEDNAKWCRRNTEEDERGCIEQQLIELCNAEADSVSLTSILPTFSLDNGNHNLRRRVSEEALPVSSRQIVNVDGDVVPVVGSTSTFMAGPSSRACLHTNTLPHGRRVTRKRTGGGDDAASRVGIIGEDDNGPYPIEVHRVTLFKDTVYEDFGFSVSDGLYERGVYVNRIRPNGPADIGGILRSFDRVLQVNDTKTHDFDCCLTVPLIAAAGDRIRLVVVRNPYVGLAPRLMRGGGIGMVCGGPLPWMEEEQERGMSTTQGENGDSITKSL